VTKIDAGHITDMELNLVKMQDSAYENFVESIRSPQTKRNYIRDIQVFLKLIPNSIFEENKIKHKKNISIRRQM
jgi:hypothetical protein